MTGEPDDIISATARFVAAFGTGISEAQRHACRRVAERVVLDDRYRARALAGERIDLGHLLALGSAADAAVAALGLPATPTKPVVRGLEITFVDDAYMRLQSLLQETHPDFVVPAVMEELANQLAMTEAELNKAREATEAAERELQRVRAEMAPPLELRVVEPRHDSGGPSPAAPTPVKAPGRTATHSEWAWAGLLADTNSHFAGEAAPGISHGSEYLPPDRFDANGKRIP
jgi:hypothetical protein